MNIETLVSYLDHPAEATAWLRTLGLNDTARGHANLVQLARTGVTVGFAGGHVRAVGGVPASAQRPGHGAEQPGAVRGGGAQSAVVGLALRARSRGAADAAANLLHQPAPQRPAGQRSGKFRPAAADRRAAGGARAAGGEICAEVAALADEPAVLAVLRRFKRRETLRIAYGDIIREQPIETVHGRFRFWPTRSVEAALQAAWRKLVENARHAAPRRRRPARFVVLALGKLGGWN